MTIHVGRVAFSAKKILGQRAAVMRDLKSSWGNTWSWIWQRKSAITLCPTSISSPFEGICQVLSAFATWWTRPSCLCDQNNFTHLFHFPKLWVYLCLKRLDQWRLKRWEGRCLMSLPTISQTSPTSLCLEYTPKVLRAKFHSGNATLKEARAKGIDVYATSEYLTLNINNILSPKVSPPEVRKGVRGKSL